MSESLIHIKQVSDNDFDQVSLFFNDIIHSTYQPLFAPDELQQEMATLPEQFHRLWSQRNYPGAAFFIALCNDTLAGFIFMRAVDQTTIFLDYLFVASLYRRQGIAQLLQEAALSHILITHPQVASMQLKVYKNNHKAYNYYLKRGFVTISESEKRFTMERKL